MLLVYRVGNCGVCINSFIVDEGAPILKVFFIRLRAGSFQFDFTGLFWGFLKKNSKLIV